jgi:chromosomal replication initiator protein
MELIWEKVKTVIKQNIPGHSFKMWIEPLKYNCVKNDRITVSCPNLFIKKRVQENYRNLLESELNKLSQNRLVLNFLISDPKDAPAKSSRASHQSAAQCLEKTEGHQKFIPQLRFQAPLGRLLRKDYTFDNFVVGRNNDFAYSAALSMASNRFSAQNSLFLLSKTGMGKSHLSQAVGHQILSSKPMERVYYITAEDFTNEMIHAFRHDSIGRFKEKYRSNCDVLLLEDIHFLSGKERTQVELSLALDYLYENNKKIIFTSCFLPGEIPKLSEQLGSRLSCGLISNIDPPDFPTRVRILQKKCKARGLQIPDNVINYMADELSDNVRQLESGLIGVAAKSSLLGKKIDLELAKSVIQNITKRNKTITLSIIKKLVCQDFRISEKDIVSRSRKQSIVVPRQISMYLARKFTQQPLQAIGKSFNRQHATAIHSIGIIDQEIKKGGPIRKQVEYLSKKLEEGNF